MSLKMITEFKWIILNNSIYKITSIFYTEKEKIEWVKYYNLALAVNSYTDETKQYDISQITYNFVATLDWCTIENWYILLKTLPEFSSAVDC
jgi:hypothetical protein